MPSQAQANSRSFIAEYCRNINHGSQAAFSFGGILLAASLVKIKNVLDALTGPSSKEARTPSITVGVDERRDFGVLLGRTHSFRILQRR